MGCYDPFKVTPDPTSAEPSGPDPNPAAPGQPVARLVSLLPKVMGRLSPKARFAMSIGLVAMLLLAISAFFSAPSATLRLVCHHDFRSAEMTISIDGDVVLTETLTGAVKKWLGVVERSGGTYTRSIPVSSGRHRVEVRLRAPGYDRTRSIEANFSRGTSNTLSVDSGRDLSLVWRGPDRGVGGTEADAGSFPWLKYAGSIFGTIFASIISASIGVFVQDFLRARKAELSEGKKRF